MISIKVHLKGREVLVAACDEELLGKTLNEGNLKFHLSKDFYGGMKGGKSLLKEQLERATIANLIGKEVVECAIDAKFISKESVLEIDGVPHAQLARMI